MQLDIALWCKNQIEHSIWDESLLFNCLEHSGRTELPHLWEARVAFKASPSSQHQHCTDEAQKAKTVLSIYIYIYIYTHLGGWLDVTSHNLTLAHHRVSSSSVVRASDI